MKKIVTSVSLILFLSVGFAAGAQANPPVLPVGELKVDVDGAIGATEYPVSFESGKMTLRLARDAKHVYAAISGETTGWVAIGFGSPKMDAALMVLGFVGTDGKAQLKIQRGSGHTHGDVESDALVQFSMKESAGVTTLEVSLKAPSVIAAGATELPVIFAMGGADSFVGFHRARSSQLVRLK